MWKEEIHRGKKRRDLGTLFRGQEDEKKEERGGRGESPAGRGDEKAHSSAATNEASPKRGSWGEGQKGKERRHRGGVKSCGAWHIRTHRVGKALEKTVDKWLKTGGAQEGITTSVE